MAINPTGETPLARPVPINRSESESVWRGEIDASCRRFGSRHNRQARDTGSRW